MLPHCSPWHTSNKVRCIYFLCRIVWIWWGNYFRWIAILDQRTFIKIETLHGCTGATVYELLQEVCGDSKLCLSTISPWSQRFLKARTVLKTSNTLVGWKLLLHTTHWQPLLLPFWRKTDIWSMKRLLEIWSTKSSIHSVLTEVLEKRKITACSMTSQNPSYHL